nr:immunoglobulin heavy chain junction region [Macaca mulatta]
CARGLREQITFDLW